MDVGSEVRRATCECDRISCSPLSDGWIVASRAEAQEPRVRVRDSSCEPKRLKSLVRVLTNVPPLVVINPLNDGARRHIHDQAHVRDLLQHQGQRAGSVPLSTRSAAKSEARFILLSAPNNNPSRSMRAQSGAG